MRPLFSARKCLYPKISRLSLEQSIACLLRLDLGRPRELSAPARKSRRLEAADRLAAANGIPIVMQRGWSGETLALSAACVRWGADDLVCVHRLHANPGEADCGF